VKLRFVKIGALGRDWYVKLTFWKVILPVGDDRFPEAAGIGSDDTGWGAEHEPETASIEGFWSCNAKTRDAAPLARPMSGARLNI
jgi:hypothetical protein